MWKVEENLTGVRTTVLSANRLAVQHAIH